MEVKVNSKWYDDGNFDLNTFTYGQSLSDTDGLQWTVRITSLDSRAKCNRMTEILALLGMPQLRVRWSKRGESIQRAYNGLVMAEYSLPLKQPLRVTV